MSLILATALLSQCAGGVCLPSVPQSFGSYSATSSYQSSWSGPMSSYPVVPSPPIPLLRPTWPVMVEYPRHHPWDWRVKSKVVYKLRRGFP